MNFQLMNPVFPAKSKILTVKSLFFIIAFLLFALPVSGQYYLSGQDPASIKWQQLQTKHFRIIFPKQYQSKVNHIANLFELSYPEVNTDLNARLLKSDLILHTQSVISNASVAWAPRRLDFYHTPAQDGYSQEWYKQLSLHELRHISQISRLNEGFGKGVSTIFGQQGTAAILGLFVPTWFMEGDAVVSETAHSFSGRGRQALFEAGLRTQILSKGYYKYDKAYFGSYKDYIPNVYELGYFLVGYNKHKFGAALWEKALDQTARTPYSLRPFRNGLKEVSGMGKNPLYISTLAALEKEWLQQDANTHLTEIDIQSPVNKYYTSYRFPQVLKDGSIVAVRTSIDDTPKIVVLRDGNEKVLFVPGSTFNQSLSTVDSFVVWNEYQSDLRWSNRDFSVIKIGNVHTGKIKQLTSKTQFFSPDFSSDAKKIVVTETSELGTHALVVLKTETAEVLYRFSSDTLFFQNPQWMDDCVHIIAVVTGEKGKSLIKLNTTTSEMEVLLPATYTDFGVTDVKGNTILLHGSWSGINNIFVFDLNTNTIKQLTSSRFGAADATIDLTANRLVYADYTSDGFNIVHTSMNNCLDLPLEQIENHAFDLAGHLSEDQSFNIDNVIVPDSSYVIKKYSKMANLFNLHSWSPVYINAETQEAGLGASVFSQNTLSTMVTQLGYKYDLNEQTGKTSLNISYLGLYPNLDFGISNGLRRSQQIVDDSLYNLKWNETNYSLGARIPFNLTKDRWLKGIQPGFSFSQLYRKMDPSVGLSFKQDFTTSFSYDIYAYNQSRTSAKDIYPAWGQTIRLIYRHSPFDADPSKQAFASANLYFPGFVKHHGFKLYLGWQQQESGYYTYSSLTSIPRGYTDVFVRNNMTYKIDYAFPVMYPELILPTIVYLKRIRAGLFVDYLSGLGDNSETSLLSTGIEIYSDWHFLNLPAPIVIGGRFSHTFEDNKFVPEFLFGINFGALY